MPPAWVKAPPTYSVPLALIIPSSRLQLVDPYTLLGADGKPIIERWRVQLLSSARDLLEAACDRPATPRTAPAAAASAALLAVGDPDCGGVAGVCPEIAAASAAPPGAPAEATRIATRFAAEPARSATLLLGAQASERAVKQALAGKRYLHFATHGYYCERLGGLASLVREDLRVDPLLLCGLLLAPGPAGDREDGVFTAQEVVGGDLRAADWVVLSACSSGLGREVPGEGLFGLRRAFEMAGARTVVMALWNVQDDTTRRLMERLYAYRLQDGLPAVSALRRAALELLEAARARYHRLHPALWGGFVVEGGNGR